MEDEFQNEETLTKYGFRDEDNIDSKDEQSHSVEYKLGARNSALIDSGVTVESILSLLKL